MAVYSKAFFDLQISFAEKVQELTGMPLEEALLTHTNLYVRLGFGREFDAAHPGWREYVAGLGGDVREATYRFYLQDPETNTAAPVVATRGCFSYAVPGGDHVRLHFRNVEPPGLSPLSASRADARRADLAALFAEMKESVPGDMPVVGVSWLYNLHAYRRLFPAAYGASVRVVPDKFRSMPLWGQFVDRRGELKESMTRPFLTSLGSVTSVEELGACFPFQVLTARAPAQEFHEHYGI